MFKWRKFLQTFPFQCIHNRKLHDSFLLGYLSDVTWAWWRFKSPTLDCLFKSLLRIWSVPTRCGHIMTCLKGIPKIRLTNAKEILFFLLISVTPTYIIYREILVTHIHIYIYIYSSVHMQLRTKISKIHHSYILWVENFYISSDYLLLVSPKLGVGPFVWEPWHLDLWSNMNDNGPLTRCVKLRVAHALAMPGPFSPPPTSKETASQHACRDR